MRGERFYADRLHRGLAAVIVLLALLMQGISPYLPMPTMGGLTSWQIAGLETCLDLARGGDRKAPNYPAHDGQCSVCLVVTQAGSTEAPPTLALPVSTLVAPAEHPLVSDARGSSAPSFAFSSRAPPAAV